jgi:L-fuculose-phosphate aldolase
MNFSLLHPREQIVHIMARIYRQRMTTLSGGNLSVRDDNGDMWITPAGIDKGTLTPQDMMCVRTDGSLDGPHRPSSEYPFHRAIYAQRPDLHAIVHAHPPALVAFSIAGEIPDTRIIPQANRVCGSVGFAPYALPGSEQLGENIAAIFAQGHGVVLLENHGIATGGQDLLEAFQRLETLDFCARTLIQARGLIRTSGILPAEAAVSTLSDAQLALFDHRQHRLPEFTPAGHSSRERALRRQIVDIVHRACDRTLMISTEGVVSARVDAAASADGVTFLITPTGMDRRSMAIEDIVLVANGRRERGKLPSRSVNLHQAIYRQHPEIGSVITAQAPHATAYAIVTQRFDTKLIPESYILLMDVPKIPFGTLYQAPARVAAHLSRRVPVLIAQNDCILTTGADVLQAFDRLEVAEFSAQTLLDTLTKLGTLAPIGEADIQDLAERFGLED